MIENVFCGFGKQNENGLVVPVAIWPAQESSRYTVTPVPRFYVAAASSQTGTIIDQRRLGSRGTVDFLAQPGRTVATITHLSNGTFSAPVFSSFPAGLEREEQPAILVDQIEQTEQNEQNEQEEQGEQEYQEEQKDQEEQKAQEEQKEQKEQKQQKQQKEY